MNIQQTMVSMLQEIVDGMKEAETKCPEMAFTLNSDGIRFKTDSFGIVEASFNVTAGLKDPKEKE